MLLFSISMIVEQALHVEENVNLAILDSGASSHIYRKIPNNFIKYSSKTEKLKLPDGSLISSIGRIDTDFEKRVLIVPFPEYSGGKE